MAENELKPCPFCGYSGLVTTQERDMQGYRVVFTYCPMCASRGPEINQGYYSLEFAREQARLSWNRRVGNDRE